MSGGRWSDLRARVLTYGLVALLVFGVVNEVEAWPVTSYRLFSAVRTDRGLRTDLQLVARDGSVRPLRLDGDTVSTTAHQYRTLPADAPAVQRRKALAWLDAAGVDPATVRAVRLVRVGLRLDPDGGAPTELWRHTLVEVEL